MSKRILVVEDQPDNRQILRDLLTSADFEVIEAEDGETGLAAAATRKFARSVRLPAFRLVGATRSRPARGRE